MTAEEHSKGSSKSKMEKVKKYLDKINLNVSQRQAPFIFAAFEFHRQDRLEDYFDAIRLATPGCDDIEDLLSMPSGRGQLELTDEVRNSVEKYFAQRPK